MIEEEDITIYDSSMGMTNGVQFSLEITRTDVDELIDIRNDSLVNQKLRERIVNLADLWDGKESQRYGEALQNILKELEIKDMPKFYTKESINQIIDELIKERNE